MQDFDFAVIGGGILGLSVAWAIWQSRPSARLAVIEKENRWASHQTGRNSGIIHSGIYYKPGSLKARLCRNGNLFMVEFCREYEMPHEVCGKVIVATKQEELSLLERLYARGIAVSVRRLSASQALELEPHVKCSFGIHVPSTGIVDFAAVCSKLAELIQQNGVKLRLGTRVCEIQTRGDRTILETSTGTLTSRCIINCAGLHSDRVARLAGDEARCSYCALPWRILRTKTRTQTLGSKSYLSCAGPEFPFLGVHFTRMIDGSVHAGPTAVLSFKREGYHRTSFEWRDLKLPWILEIGDKAREIRSRGMHRSFSKKALVRSLQQLVPEICAEDLIHSEAGVRAEAVLPDGGLVD